MKHMLTSIFMIAISVYLGLGAILYFSQGALIYFPTPESEGSELDVRVFEHQGVQLKILVLNPGKENAVIYFGGNSEAVEFNADDLSNILPEHSIYLVNYRGYGGSTGTPQESAFYADALMVYDHIVPDHKSVSVIGRSLGSGVATLLASKRAVDKLVLVTPFDSLEQVAKKHYPIYPVSLLLKDKYDSAGRAALINSDTLLLIAENDKVVKPEHAYALAAAFTHKPANIIVISEAEHNTITAFSLYYEQLKRFIEQ